MQRLTVNRFTKGRNTDVSKALIGIDQYIEAHNVELVGDGNFYALKNIKGTTNVKNIAGNAECLGVFRNNYLISSEQKQCLTIFTLSSGLFKIWAYDIDAATLYELYQETVDEDYVTDDRVVDAHNYPENGIDIIYFTDNYHEVRKVRCEIPSPYIANFLTEFDLSVQRRGGLGNITYLMRITGSLLSGTYQFAYRMVDPATKTLTKWSSLTNPYHIYTSNHSGNTPVYSGIGLPTPYGLEFNVNPTSEELSEFAYFQLAVVENIYPTTGTSTTASLLPIEPIANRTGYKYKANTKVGTITIDELTVDLAQIETVKTLNIKQNRLFLANAKYVSFDFDNGEPAISSGSISRRSVGPGSYADSDFSSKYLSYFRDEVYRFGIVYYDKYGNKAPVKVLDMSSVTNNRILSGLIDMKFPARNFSPTYSIFGAGNTLQALGLNLVGIKNHPTWAVKFEIVRVKRMENILFQTPVVPLTTVRGIGALDNYPNTATYNQNAAYTSFAVANKSYPNAIPQTNDEVLVTKNLYWPELRSIGKVATTSGSGNNVTEAGEAKFNLETTFQFAAIFPQQTLYGDTSFSFTGAESLEPIDYALLKVNVNSFDQTRTPIAIVDGDDINTNITGTFYATTANQYYFDNVSSKSTANMTPQSITAYEFVANESAGTEIGGTSLFKFDNLKTQGLDFGYTPTVCAMGVVKLQTSMEEVYQHSRSFIAGTYNVRSDLGYVVGSSGTMYQQSSQFTNDYVNTYPGAVYTGAVTIANVTLGLQDDRYGPAESTHEFISTGASYSFTPSELIDVQAGNPVLVDLEVFGGDCFVSQHVFKISNSSYSLVNAPKIFSISQNGPQLTSKWNNLYFTNRAGTAISLPVPLENVGQFLEVILESKYNGAVMDIDILNGTVSGGSIPIMEVSDKASIRSPLTYKYNINLSKQNAEKVYFPQPQFSFIQTDFQARVLYSDLKIYNTSEQGFDVFRVLNYYDLEEKRGAITKLVIAEDDLHAVQVRGVVYLPTGQVQLQQTDGSQLAVGTSDVIARPIVVDSERGGQHLRGIVETGKVVFIPDNINKTIYVLSGKQLVDIVSEAQNNTEFRELFLNVLPEKNVIGIYDPIRLEYWLVDNLNFRCEVFNEKLGFIGEYDFSENSVLTGAVYNDQQLYLIGTGIDSNELAVHEMYTGPENNLMGDIVVPSVTVVVNPDDDVAKVFDNTMLAASDKLSTMDLEVERETSMGNQVITDIDLNVNSIEGNYRVKIPLDSDKSRLRGMRMITTIKWGDLSSKLSAIYTKYRLSPKTPF